MAKTDEHEVHEQRLAAALRDLVHQIDVGDYRDKRGHDLTHNLAFLKAQAIVDEFGVSHAQLCDTLDDCDVNGDLVDAARKIFDLKRAKPSPTPVQFQPWRAGP